MLCVTCSLQDQPREPRTNSCPLGFMYECFILYAFVRSSNTLSMADGDVAKPDREPLFYVECYEARVS